MSPMTPTFEMYAVHLLMCSPHPLSRVWTSSPADEIAKRVGEALDKLPLTPVARKQAISLMTQLTAQRAFFEGIADTMKFSDLYAGDEPHPPVGVDAIIIKKMQELDQQLGPIQNLAAKAKS